MTTYIVSARNDGRGGIKPFGTYGKNQAGAKVDIGGKYYTVTKDGRVNIPKHIMDMGTKGKDGRMRIDITFSAEKGKHGWRQVKTIVSNPLKADANKETGDKPSRFRMKNREELLPKDSGEANWSP
jgi:hypothetical protein